jgi:hypothetical protein
MNVQVIIKFCYGNTDTGTGQNWKSGNPYLPLSASYVNAPPKNLKDFFALFK